ncbi:MAG: chromate transporter [Acholeplasmataceae bacterium]|nr:chromate transporter [Acholeplasmataceae bacterium]
MELLILFWTFFKIGLFTFGGGYAMIPLIRQEVVETGIISYDLFIDFIGISESSPGPFAINIATFIGMNQHGLLGAFAATLGVALPSFIIILLIASLGSKFLNSKGVTHAFKGLKPAVIGLILSVAFGLSIRAFYPNIDFKHMLFDFSEFNLIGLIILMIIGLLTIFFKKMSPIQMILISAFLGILFYGFLPF